MDASHRGNLSTFLKKLSSVPNTFIDEMFALYDPDTVQTDFVVNLDAVAKWLHVTKGGLNKTLAESYKQGVDYVVSRVPNPMVTGKYGRNTYKQILLTPDCFKRLCMRSRGKTAENVRSYFIAVETLVSKYRKQMMDGMEQEIRQLESGNRARRLAKAHGRAGYVYVLKASTKYDTVVKIGRTNDLTRRLREHGAALADDPEVLYIYRTDDAYAVETCVKGWLKTRQWGRGISKYKEVYKADIDMIRNVINVCGSVGTVLKPEGEPQKGGGVGQLFIMISHENSNKG